MAETVIEFPRMGGPNMPPRELFELILNALSGVHSDLATEDGKRVYLAYLVASQGVKREPAREDRITELCDELGLPGAD